MIWSTGCYLFLLLFYLRFVIGEQMDAVQYCEVHFLVYALYALLNHEKMIFYSLF